MKFKLLWLIDSSVVENARAYIVTGTDRGKFEKNIVFDEKTKSPNPFKSHGLFFYKKINIEEICFASESNVVFVTL